MAPRVPDRQALPEPLVPQAPLGPKEPLDLQERPALPDPQARPGPLDLLVPQARSAAPGRTAVCASTGMARPARTPLTRRPSPIRATALSPRSPSLFNSPISRWFSERPLTFWTPVVT